MNGHNASKSESDEVSRATLRQFLGLPDGFPITDQELVYRSQLKLRQIKENTGIKPKPFWRVWK